MANYRLSQYVCAWPWANLAINGLASSRRQAILIRASKGTIIRKMTEAAFAKEIENLYADTYRARPTSNPVLLATAFTSEAIINLLRLLRLSLLFFVSLALLQTQSRHVSWRRGTIWSALVRAIYVASLWTSMIVYRLFLHPLRKSPNPLEC